MDRIRECEGNLDCLLVLLADLSRLDGMREQRDMMVGTCRPRVNSSLSFLFVPPAEGRLGQDVESYSCL